MYSSAHCKEAVIYSDLKLHILRNEVHHQQDFDMRLYLQAFDLALKGMKITPIDRYAVVFPE